MAKDFLRTADRTCCGVIQEAKYQAREKHTLQNKPQPWIVLKLTIGITILIIGYASYVYLGRLCVPMMLKQDGALGSQATGIVFCVVLCLLLIMVIWSYAKVVFTPPGYAKDFVSKSELPTFPVARPPRKSQDIDDIGGTEYKPASTQTPAEVSQMPSGSGSANGSFVTKPAPTHKPAQQKSRAVPQELDTNAGVLDALPPPVPSPRDLEEGRGPASRSRNADPPPLFSRKPPTTPVLLPEYRYCYRDELVKPFRAHHCRACGTCVLKYDHHCPWVGQCVGARNHKFFMNFVLWAVLFCVWIFITLLILVAKEGSKPNGDIDPQKIAVIGLAGIFGLFTVALFISHVHLISLNQTTVESLGFRAISEREELTLAQMHPWYRFGAKRRARRQWDFEWGRIGREGNLWWLGSKRENWEAVMGKNVWWWFLPIGHSSSNGKTYPINPRFDSEGLWRRRAEWPSELR